MDARENLSKEVKFKLLVNERKEEANEDLGEEHSRLREQLTQSKAPENTWCPQEQRGEHHR